MKFQLVFDHWRDKEGKPVEGVRRIELEMGSFHGGTCFDVMADFSADDIIDFASAHRDGHCAVFYVANDTVVDGAVQLAVHMNGQRENYKRRIVELERQVEYYKNLPAQTDIPGLKQEE